MHQCTRLIARCAAIIISRHSNMGKQTQVSGSCLEARSEFYFYSALPETTTMQRIQMRQDTLKKENIIKKKLPLSDVLG